MIMLQKLIVDYSSANCVTLIMKRKNSCQLIQFYFTKLLKNLTDGIEKSCTTVQGDQTSPIQRQYKMLIIQIKMCYINFKDLTGLENRYKTVHEGKLYKSNICNEDFTSMLNVRKKNKCLIIKFC